MEDYRNPAAKYDLTQVFSAVNCPRDVSPWTSRYPENRGILTANRHVRCGADGGRVLTARQAWRGAIRRVP